MTGWQIVGIVGLASSVVGLGGFFYRITVWTNRHTLEKINQSIEESTKESNQKIDSVHAQLLPNGGKSMRDDISKIKAQTDANGAHLAKQDEHLANQDKKIDALNSRVDVALIVMADRRRSTPKKSTTTTTRRKATDGK